LETKLSPSSYDGFECSGIFCLPIVPLQHELNKEIFFLFCLFSEKKYDPNFFFDENFIKPNSKIFVKEKELSLF